MPIQLLHPRDRAASEQMTTALRAGLDEKLSQLPAAFDRLLLLSKLQAMIADCHRDVFAEWLSLPLEEQHKSLVEGICRVAQNGALPKKWTSLSWYSDLIPKGGVPEPARVLFFTNLDIILEIIRTERQSDAAMPCGGPEGPRALFRSL